MATAVHCRGRAVCSRRAMGFEASHGQTVEAAWLEPDERIALQARIDHVRKSREAIRHYKLGEALTNPRVLGLSFVYFGLLCGLYGLVYWLPQIVKGVATEIGLDNFRRS